MDSPLCFEGVVAVDGLVDWYWVGGVGNRFGSTRSPNPVMFAPPLLFHRSLSFIASPGKVAVTQRNTGQYPCRHAFTGMGSHGPAVLNPSGSRADFEDKATIHLPLDALGVLTQYLKRDRTSRTVPPFTFSLCPRTISIPNAYHGKHRQQHSFRTDHTRPFVGIPLLYDIPGDNNERH